MWRSNTDPDRPTRIPSGIEIPTSRDRRRYFQKLQRAREYLAKMTTSGNNPYNSINQNCQVISMLNTFLGENNGPSRICIKQHQFDCASRSGSACFNFAGIHQWGILCILLATKLARKIQRIVIRYGLVVRIKRPYAASCRSPS